jgi:hypothetical protein
LLTRDGQRNHASAGERGVLTSSTVFSTANAFTSSAARFGEPEVSPPWVDATAFLNSLLPGNKVPPLTLGGLLALVVVGVDVPLASLAMADAEDERDFDSFVSRRIVIGP